MLETRAVIVKTDGLYAMVQTSQTGGCEQCGGKSCGAGKLSQLFCNSPHQFRVDNSIRASVGDQVIVSVAEGAILHGISLVYLLPLMLLLLGASFGNIWAGQVEQRDSYAAMGALLGLAAGFVFAKWISLRQLGNCSQPYVARQFRE